ncbi:DNA mismatch endonuclease Vsr [Mesorhizobium loti]|uniref:Very short patch repair endonuclease n=2 Tax=Rhizobium loti TaxID=381 RepID=A0A6M7TZ07_RHILI|nr:very short patch repair endonuclease [Mesorhizobium loti]QKC68387.1 DNA mismatch endonuclease Vsr [Mesorhizobium loti]
MGLVRSKNSKPELAVRKLVHALGFRFRLHRRDLAGTPDLTFPGRRKVIFVHGCFWHRHSDPSCKLARLPRSRLDFWQPKLNANAERDRVNVGKLEADGWKVLVVWECEVSRRGQAELAERLRTFLST